MGCGAAALSSTHIFRYYQVLRRAVLPLVENSHLKDWMDGYKVSGSRFLTLCIFERTVAVLAPAAGTEHHRRAAQTADL